MRQFLKRIKAKRLDQDISTPTECAPPVTLRQNWVKRLTSGLGRTRAQLGNAIGRLVLGAKSIDTDLLEEIEMQLLQADIGIEATERIIDDLTQRLARKQLNDMTALIDALQVNLYEMIAPCMQPLAIDKTHRPYVILMVGVNGNGKTTTIGKLTKYLQHQQHSVLLAAGDTFRAAAVEQLQAWGKQNEVPVIAQGQGADSASVIFDAVQAAKARHIDVVIADTAGRLHTQSNLMAELKKIKRVIQKLDADAPHEIMLVLDAGTGQNAMNQVREFHDTMGLTGITLTKLDGTAKGGMIFAVANQWQIPIRFIGVGEGIDDLQPFDAETFVSALFPDELTQDSCQVKQDDHITTH